VPQVLNIEYIRQLLVRLAPSNLGSHSKFPLETSEEEERVPEKTKILHKHKNVMVLFPRFLPTKPLN